MQHPKVQGGHFGSDKTEATVVERWYFPNIFKHVAGSMKCCDVCHCINTYKLQKANKTLHLIPEPLRVWIQIGSGLIHLLIESDSYRHIVTAVYYTVILLRQSN